MSTFTPEERARVLSPLDPLAGVRFQHRAEREGQAKRRAAERVSAPRVAEMRAEDRQSEARLARLGLAKSAERIAAVRATPCPEHGAEAGAACFGSAVGTVGYCLARWRAGLSALALARPRFTVEAPHMDELGAHAAVIRTVQRHDRQREAGVLDTERRRRSRVVYTTGFGPARGTASPAEGTPTPTAGRTRRDSDPLHAAAGLWNEDVEAVAL